MRTARAFLILFSLVSVLAAPVAFAQSCTCAGDQTDNFEDGVLTWIPSASCGFSTEFAGTLRNIKGAGCNGAAQAIFGSTLCADFDVSMDFNQFNFRQGTLTGTRTAALRVTRLDNSLVSAIERHYTAFVGGCVPAGLSYKAYTTDASACSATWVPNNSQTGRLRITRQGDILKMFYLDTTLTWVEVLSASVTTDPLRLLVETTSDQDTEAWAFLWDNFALTAPGCPVSVAARTWGSAKNLYR